MTKPTIERTVNPELTPLTANRVVYEDEGGVLMRRFESTTDQRVCPGCGAKTAFCPTWGVCDWETFSDEEDAREDSEQALPA